MKIIEQGSITSPKGFYGVGKHVGIKKANKDLALIYSEVDAISAGTFTTNVVKAAPVLWDQNIVNNYETARVIAINSGVANACTGDQGTFTNEMFATMVGNQFGIQKENVLICSTGVIGKQLPLEPIETGVIGIKEELSNTKEAGIEVARGIMTTDTAPKHIAVEFELNGKTVTIGGCCKGSGMIHPNMATMLGFITTDLAISKQLLTKAIKEVVTDTFNMVSVDRDTSTNDTVLVLANGLANNDPITTVDESYELFVQALYVVNEFLAKAIASDGEGATKLLEVQVHGACTKQEAVLLSKSVCTSPLVKTAIYGNDANWGRILCALGYAGVAFDPMCVQVFVDSEHGSVQLVENGMATDYREEFATNVLSGKEVTIRIYLEDGSQKATAWGCDLTYDYIKINADYRS